MAEGWFDHKMYIRSLFVGRPGTNNDLDVFVVSPFVQQIVNREFKFRMGEENTVTYDGAVRNVVYLLEYGIYPEYSIFFKPIHHPRNEKEIIYAVRQEAVRKYIERCLGGGGVLQSHFEIIYREKRRWDKEEVDGISDVCNILHNRLVRIGKNGEENKNVVMKLCEEHNECERNYLEQVGTDLATTGEVPDGNWSGDVAETG